MLMDRLSSPLSLRLSRRDLLKAGAAAGLGTMGATMLGTRGGFAQDVVLDPAELELWHQDWPPINAAYQGLKEAVEAAQPNVRITLTPLPYEQLLAKILPSIAAGEEADLMMVYSSWLVASPIAELFTPVAPEIVSVEEAEALFYPAALSEGLRGDALYYLPFLNGMGGSTFTYNLAHLEEKGIDPASIQTWEDLVDAGKELVVWEGDELRRSGIAFSPYISSAWVTGIRQLGGEYFDPESGRFNLTSPEAKESLRLIDELLKVHRVDDILKAAPSHANMETAYGGSVGFPQALSSITNFGSWIVSGDPDTYPGLEVGIFPMPRMGDATDEIELSHNAVHVLSRKLMDDPAKRAAAAYFIGHFADPEAFLPLVDVYGGSVIVPSVARDPRVTERRWGSLQQQYDELVWPRAVFEHHHIPDWNITGAWTFLYRIFKDSEPVDQVLAEMEANANQLEEDARDRLGLL
jgi:ABC-type glycerol-3-phosphate transport system substrate-binding protein